MSYNAFTDSPEVVCHALLCPNHSRHLLFLPPFTSSSLRLLASLLTSAVVFPSPVAPLCLSQDTS